MKKLFLLILVTIFVTACNQKPESLENLVCKDGKTFIKEDNDLYSGEVVTFYQNGQKQLVELVKDGKKHGKHINYYKTGQKKVEGEYENGKRKGVWKWWNEKGEVDFKIDYSSNLSLRF